MKINGTQSVIKALQKFGQEGTEAIKANVEASGYIMQAEAMQRVPVDIGNLKASIKIEFSNNGLTTTLVQVTEIAPYGPFIEWGTGGLVTIPEGMQELASQFKGAGLRQVNLRPQPFMFPAWDKERRAFVERLKKELELLAKKA